MNHPIRSTEHRGSITLITRVDATALPTLADQLDPGSTVEIVVTRDVPDNARTHLTELSAGGVHVKLVGTPEAHHAWLTTLQAGGA